MSSTTIRRDLPILLLAIVGFLYVAEWFFGGNVIPQLSTFKGIMGTMVSVIAWTAVGVGTIYGISSEYYLVRRNRNWQQYVTSGSMFLMMIIMAIIWMWQWSGPGRAVGYAFQSPEWRWWLLNVYSNQTQAQYAIMFLYQCGAVYRVLRVRSMETTVFTLAGLAFILKSIPLFLTVPGVSEIGDWVQGAPTLGGTRAATLTASLGALVIGLRALVGKEQTTIEVK